MAGLVWPGPVNPTNNQEIQFVSGIIATRSTAISSRAAGLTTQRHIKTRTTSSTTSSSAFLSLRPYRASSADTTTTFLSVSSSSYNYNSSRSAVKTTATPSSNDRYPHH
ncbi:hypothetical protein FRACYDRAFT_248970 [Fragilariopsis cylindrus CCMP1102]|uniref:Uncharacterized protein n=1 Tax=Fragilariopsis cylindrus CCMP1102 TaxID=635003 RepID=A0A1E7ETC7_9STRA|nr:hypothetical protein FRACYDRAFT_248970 [Fragilariopsis cylindrus CCMP1102]|eukprot:OEU09085.1 hypothetical protein FRACYDRAFT_248970 [Fragilariopsis cylindrus CCMP1102]